jgi:starch synthase (maltosyl-transferring)
VTIAITKSKTMTAAPGRIALQYPQPAVDDGRYPIKRCVGDAVAFSCDIFRDGHELLRAVVRYRAPGSRRWQETELERIDAHLEGVRWAGTFTVDQPGIWRYDVEAWTDRFGTWRDELERKFRAGLLDIGSEVSEGARLLHDSAAAATSKAARAIIEEALAALEDEQLDRAVRCEAALDLALYEVVERVQPRTDATTLPQPLELLAERERARFSTWYELFPRSWGGLPGVEQQLPRLAELGFDIVYLPPIHPIGLTNRKGPRQRAPGGTGGPGLAVVDRRRQRRPRRDPRRTWQRRGSS